MAGPQPKATPLKVLNINGWLWGPFRLDVISLPSTCPNLQAKLMQGAIYNLELFQGTVLTFHILTT
jgi:hypothetical protein